MTLSAAIPAFNAAGTLPRVIAALRAQMPAGQRGQILVLDNGSTDSSREVASEEGAEVIRMEANAGRGAARARILETAGSALLFMCDATLEIGAGFIARALPWFEDPKVAGAFGRVVQPPSRVASDRWRGRHLFRSVPNPAPDRRALLATGVCVLRTEAARAVGGFDPHLQANEDADLGRRLLAAGYDVVSDPQLQAAPLTSDTIPQVLARYVRWNTQGPMSWSDYARKIAFSARVMAREDLRAGDPLSAMISLAAPHCQFWKSRGHAARERSRR